MTTAAYNCFQLSAKTNDIIESAVFIGRKDVAARRTICDSRVLQAVKEDAHFITLRVPDFNQNFNFLTLT